MTLALLVSSLYAQTDVVADNGRDASHYHKEPELRHGERNGSWFFHGVTSVVGLQVDQSKKHDRKNSQCEKPGIALCINLGVGTAIAKIKWIPIHGFLVGWPASSERNVVAFLARMNQLAALGADDVVRVKRSIL